MNSLLKYLLVLQISLTSALDPIILAPKNISGVPVAVVWIQGRNCEPAAYEKVAEIV